MLKFLEDDQHLHDLAEQLIAWIQEKKGENIEVIDVRERSSYADALIICTGSGDLHIRAIADHVLDGAREKKFQVLSREGLENAVWVLIDFGEIILHIFQDETRKYYDLEDLWTAREAKIIRIGTDYDQGTNL